MLLPLRTTRKTASVDAEEDAQSGEEDAEKAGQTQSKTQVPLGATTLCEGVLKDEVIRFGVVSCEVPASRGWLEGVGY